MMFALIFLGTVPVADEGVLFSWTAFGLAFAFLILTIVLAGVQYLYCRWHWVLTPSSITRRYCAALIILPAFYTISTVVENMLIGPGSNHLPYESIPQASLILFVHYLAYRNGQPATITLGITLVTATATMSAAALLIGEAPIRPAQWALGATALILLAYTLFKASCTKRAFLSGRFTTELEPEDTGMHYSRHRWWLSPGHYVAIIVASLAVAVLAEVLDGVSPADLLLKNVLVYGLSVVGLTMVLVGLPAALHWLAAKRPLPDLGWVLWAVWLIASSSLLYLQQLMGAH